MILFLSVSEVGCDANPKRKKGKSLTYNSGKLLERYKKIKKILVYKKNAESNFCPYKVHCVFPFRGICDVWGKQLCAWEGWYKPPTKMGEVLLTLSKYCTIIITNKVNY